MSFSVNEGILKSELEPLVIIIPINIAENFVFCNVNTISRGLRSFRPSIEFSSSLPYFLLWIEHSQLFYFKLFSIVGIQVTSPICYKAGHVIGCYLKCCNAMDLEIKWSAVYWRDPVGRNASAATKKWRRGALNLDYAGGVIYWTPT